MAAGAGTVRGAAIPLFMDMNAAGAVGFEAVYLDFDQNQVTFLGEVDGAADRIALGRGENRSSGLFLAEDITGTAASSQQCTATDQYPDGSHYVLPSDA